MLSELAALMRRWPAQITGILVTLILIVSGIFLVNGNAAQLLQSRLSIAESRLQTNQSARSKVESDLAALRTENASLKTQLAKVTGDLDFASKKSAALEAACKVSEDAQRAAEAKLSACETRTPTSQAPKTSVPADISDSSSGGGTPSIGEDGVLKLNDASCIYGGAQKSDLDLIDSAAAAGDSIGLMQLQITGQMLCVPRGTKVLVTDVSWLTEQVRLLDSKYAGSSVWVPFEAVTRK